MRAQANALERAERPVTCGEELVSSRSSSEGARSARQSIQSWLDSLYYAIALYALGYLLIRNI